MMKEDISQPGTGLEIVVLQSKYDFNFSKEVVKKDIYRLTNQLWKLIPMRENEEDWKKQLHTVIIEITGLNKIFVESLNFLVLLSKLEGISEEENFENYRKTVFESISLIQELKNDLG